MILALDIGGTKTAVGLVTKNGVVRNFWNYPTKSGQGSKPFLESIKHLIKTHRTPQVNRVGIGIAGQVDSKHGFFISGPNLPLKQAPLARLLETNTHLPVTVHNDAHCFAFAEAIRGAGRGYRSVFGITIGTGIGGGFVMENLLMEGATGTSGEIGHTAVCVPSAKHSPRCACGKHGHLEAYAGGKALISRYRHLSGHTVSLFELESLFRADNRQVKIIISEAQTALAAGFSHILTIVNPNMIVIGGGLAKFRELWQHAKHLASTAMPFPVLKKISIVPGVLAERAGIIGAALLTDKRQR